LFSKTHDSKIPRFPPAFEKAGDGERPVGQHSFPKRKSFFPAMTARSTKTAFFHCPFKITVKDLPFIVNQKKRYFRNRKK